MLIVAHRETPSGLLIAGRASVREPFTALVKDGRMYVQAGAGIVADSDPAAEQQECINKSKALFRAAEEARRFASAGKRGQ